MNWNDKAVLVTGGGGFIGSHLAERLVELGARVRAMVHYNAMGAWGWLDNSQVRSELEVIPGDITDRDSVTQAVRGSEIIFHLAALIGIPYSYGAPESYVRTNIAGTMNVLQACLQQGVERIVHTSTSEVYGSARYVPMDEGHPLRGQSPYSATKIGADKLAEAYYCSFDLPVVTLRPFNTFGPRQSARAVIPTIIVQALTGDVVRLGNLQATRDLNYVADTVDGFVRAAESSGAEGEVINLGTGREAAIGALATLIAEVLKRPIRIEEEPARIRPEGSEVDRLCAANAKAAQLLGWQPQVSLREGLERTISWFADNLRYYRPDVYNV